jgi:hypothetical protein
MDACYLNLGGPMYYVGLDLHKRYVARLLPQRPCCSSTAAAPLAQPARDSLCGCHSDEELACEG